MTRSDGQDHASSQHDRHSQEWEALMEARRGPSGLSGDPGSTWQGLAEGMSFVLAATLAHGLQRGGYADAEVDERAIQENLGLEVLACARLLRQQPASIEASLEAQGVKLPARPWAGSEAATLELEARLEALFEPRLEALASKLEASWREALEAAYQGAEQAMHEHGLNTRRSVLDAPAQEFGAAMALPAIGGERDDGNGLTLPLVEPVTPGLEDRLSLALQVALAVCAHGEAPKLDHQRAREQAWEQTDETLRLIERVGEEDDPSEFARRLIEQLGEAGHNSEVISFDPATGIEERFTPEGNGVEAGTLPGIPTNGGVKA